MKIQDGNPLQSNMPEPQAPKKSWFSAHHALGVLFLFMTFAAVVSAGNYYQVNMESKNPFEPVNHKDPYEGWKTYRNEQFGFELKYPSMWKLNTSLYSDEKNVKGRAELILQDETQTWLRRFVVLVLNSENLSLEQWLAKYDTKDPMGGTNVISSRDIVFLGNKAKEQDIFGFDAIYKDITWINNDYVYAISFASDDPNDPEFTQHKKVTDKILASFKFINPVNSFESCIAAGYPMMKSYPAKCATPDGTTYVQNINVCIQVIQKAKNPKTGEIREFPTPCDVPEGWQKI